MNNHDKAYTGVFEVWVSKRGLHSDGHLSVRITLPIAAEAFAQVLRSIRVSDPSDQMSYYLRDIDSPFVWMANCFPAGADPMSIDELNYLAAKVQGLDEEGIGILEALIDPAPSFENFSELIRLVEDTVNYELIELFDEREYGQYLLDYLPDQYAETLDMLRDSDDEQDRAFADAVEIMRKSLDPYEFGYQTLKAEEGRFTDKGYLVQIGKNELEYRGLESIPDQYRVTAYKPPARVVVKSKPSVKARLAEARKSAAAKSRPARDKSKKQRDFEL